MSYRLRGLLGPGVLNTSYTTYSTPEMNALNAQVKFANLTGPNYDVLAPGDQWEFSIQGGPPNSGVYQLGDPSAYPPVRNQIGSTDGSGNYALSGTATSDNQISLYMLFLNLYAGYTDVTSPDPSKRWVDIANIGYTVDSSLGSGVVNAVLPAAPVPVYATLPVQPAYAISAAQPASQVSEPAESSTYYATADVQTATTPAASSNGTETAATTPAVSSNTLLIGGLAVVAILIMMSTGKS
jgi:hypothetical protein